MKDSGEPGPARLAEWLFRTFIMAGRARERDRLAERLHEDGIAEHQLDELREYAAAAVSKPELIPAMLSKMLATDVRDCVNSLRAWKGTQRPAAHAAYNLTERRAKLEGRPCRHEVPADWHCQSCAEQGVA